MTDTDWAIKHGWRWVSDRFIPESEDFNDPFICVKERYPGLWCIHLRPIGVIQSDAPWASLRAALRVAESIRQWRRLDETEMSCADD